MILFIAVAPAPDVDIPHQYCNGEEYYVLCPDVHCVLLVGVALRLPLLVID